MIGNQYGSVARPQVRRAAFADAFNAAEAIDYEITMMICVVERSTPRVSSTHLRPPLARLRVRAGP